MRFKPFISGLIILVFLGQSLFSSLPVWADANPQFFRMNRQWNERFRYQGVVAKEAPTRVGFLKDLKVEKAVVGGPAAELFEEKPIENPDSFVPKPPEPRFVTFDELKSQLADSLEIELEQVLSVRIPNLQRYVVTTTEKVEFFREAATDILQIKGQNVGSTFLHVWDQEGRTTIPIRVIPQRQFTSYMENLAKRIETSESFKVEYEQTRSAFYDGNSFEELGRTSLSYSQSFRVTGDTPYGYVNGEAGLREFDNKTELSTITLKLTDGRMGWLEDFDLTIMDETISPNLFILPSLRLRGATMYVDRPKDNFNLTTFFGRELSSILGTLSPTSTEQGSIDSFIGGGTYEVQPFENADWTIAYFQAYGQERADNLNQHAVEFVQEYQLSDAISLGSDFGYDWEKRAYTLFGEYQVEDFQVKAEYRDIAPLFNAITGSTGSQGLQSVRLNTQAQLTEDLGAQYSVNIFRDRVFPFLGEENHFNMSHDAEVGWILGPYSNLQFDWRGNDGSAQLSPFRDNTVGATYSHSFEFLGERMSTFARLQHVDSESLSNSDTNYRRNTISTGLQTRLFWDMFFSFKYDASVLEEVNLRSITFPRGASYSLSQSRTLGDTPFSYDINLRYLDEENTESTRSFKLGEDRFEVSGEIRYTSRDIEFYVNGRLTDIRGEDRTNENARAEGEIITGVRYLFDTHLTYEPSASFTGYVFDDVNNDGLKQEAESGYSGVRIQAGPHTAFTDETGFFKTPAVSGKKVTLRVDENDIPYGFSGSTSLQQDVFTSTADKLIYFGLVGKSAILGYVYRDLNGNGIYDEQDFGVENVKILMDRKTRRITTSGGRYRFSDVPSGDHDIRLDLASLPLGYLPVGRLRQKMQIFEGVTYRADFPVKLQRLVSGRVYVDVNENFNFDVGEKVLQGARILFGTKEILTDKDGYYLFDDIEEGDYTLSVDPASVSPYNVLMNQEISYGTDPKDVKLDIPVTGGE